MRVLIAGTLDGYMALAGKIALGRGAKVAHVETVEAALHALRSGLGADICLVDVKLDIGQLITSMKAERINTPIVACGIGTDAGAAVKAIRAGAKEYIPLPPDAELIAAVLEAVAEESNNVVGNSPALMQALRLAEQIAPSDASVLITGESGTGKEVVARFIHRKSRRSNAPFVAVNCAAIPENLLESELFGHEKGAFTGAVARRIGKFEEANGGTLLLDEISEMHPRLQAKLLRVLQEKEVDRVGGTQPVKVDVRILATSNRKLEDEVKSQNFREDLFFRLNVVSVRMPPLRERIEDIPLLAEFFVKKYAEANGVAAKAIAPSGLALLKAHSWPGNVREMENTIHRAVLLCRTVDIEPDAIMLTPGAAAGTPASSAKAASVSALTPGATANTSQPGMAGYVGQTVATVERDLIIATLDNCLGNRTHAATILGISIRTLRNKLKQYTEDGVAVPASNGNDPDDSKSAAEA